MDNDWGVLPKKGDPDSRNSTWGGAMGAVVNGQVDMSLSAWTYTLQRSKVRAIVLSDLCQCTRIIKCVFVPGFI